MSIETASKNPAATIMSRTDGRFYIAMAFVLARGPNIGVHFTRTHRNSEFR